MAHKDFDGSSPQDGINSGQLNNSTQTLQADGAAVELPSDSFVRDADMSRDGMDLVLEGPDGTVVVEGYFAAEPAPLLTSPEGSTLSPDLVDSFTSGGSDYAQNSTLNDVSPVGAVQELTGEATVTRTDGSVDTVSIGTPIFEGDVVETNANGAVNIVFSDESSFAVSEDARVAIDEYVFDPSTEGGTQNFSVLKGVFVFTSGLIGRDDPDDVSIDTPVGSIGIRGTIIAGDMNQGEITVVEGAIVLTDFQGNQMTLAGQFETAKFTPAGINNLGQLSANDVAGKFASVAGVAGDLFSSIGDAAGESQGAGNQGGADAAADDGEATEGEATADGEGGEPAAEAQGETAAEGEGEAAADGETQAEGQDGADAGEAVGEGPGPEIAPAGDALAAGETGLGPGPAAGPGPGPAAGAGPAAAGANAGPAAGNGPTGPNGPAGGLGSPGGPDPRTLENGGNGPDPDPVTVPPPETAAFTSNSFNEINTGAGPTQITLAKIQVTNPSTTLNASSFTFNNLPSAFAGDLSIVATGTNTFDVVIQNSTPLRDILDFDFSGELKDTFAGSSISFNGQNLDLGTQVTRNIQDINDDPFFGPSSSSNTAGVSGVFEAGTVDFVDGIALETFSASDGNKWSFNFHEIFFDDDFARDNGPNNLPAGTQGNIAEQLTFELSATTVDALIALSADILGVSDGGGALTLTAATPLQFDGFLNIQFANTLTASDTFNIDVRATDLAGQDTSVESFRFDVELATNFISVPPASMFLTTGGETHSLAPTAASTNGFQINSNNNQVFFSDQNDDSIIIGASGAVNGNTVHLGDGDDKITIFDGSTNNIVVGDRGNDEIIVQEAENEVYGMEGDDEFIFDLGIDGNILQGANGLDTVSGKYDGGRDELHLPNISDGGDAGANTGDIFKIQGGTANVDFSAFSNSIKNIEVLDLDDSFVQTFQLNVNDVINMTDHRNTLIIKTDNMDTLTFDNTGHDAFEQGNDIMVDGVNFESFNNGDVTLLIDANISGTAAVSGV